MASRGGGPMVDGTDGRDFLHRQRVATQYQLSATNKSRLRMCIFVHILLFCFMVLKLSPLLLDRLDIFVLEIEELNIPKPLVWEYWWCVSLPVTFLGLSAIRKNNVSTLQIYLGGIIGNGIVPVCLGLITYASDVLQILKTHSTKNVQTWQGYPVGLLWYGFLLIALQVHGFSIYSGSKLMSAWRLKSSASGGTGIGSASSSLGSGLNGNQHKPKSN